MSFFFVFRKPELLSLPQFEDTDDDENEENKGSNWSYYTKDDRGNP